MSICKLRATYLLPHKNDKFIYSLHSYIINPSVKARYSMVQLGTQNFMNQGSGEVKRILAGLSYLNGAA